METIKAGDYVVVKSVDDTSVFNIVRVQGDQKLLKSRVNLDETVGEPYTAIYQVNNRKFQRIADVPVSGKDVQGESGTCEEEGNLSNTEANPATEEESSNFNTFSNTDILKYLSKVMEEKNSTATGLRGDNSGYVDTNTAQKLKDADILQLREQGLSGSEIIKTLIQNSDTFAKKNDFAQEKWIKRKEKKYNAKYQILPANPLTICESSFKKAKDKVSNLRFDSFAQILSQSGIHAGCHVLVVESMVGMVVGAVAYKMQGKGRILSLYGGQQPHLEMARNYNLLPEYLAIIEPIPAQELGPAVQDVRSQGFTPYQVFALPQPVLSTNTTATTDETGEEEVVNSNNGNGNGNDNNNHLSEHPKKKRKVIPEPKDQINSTGRLPEAQVRLRSYLRQGVDRLIIACKYRPLPILKQALSLLAPSSPFVIFHEFLEPLVDCYEYLQSQELALRLQLSDFWCREFQTLPGRMRPEMFMSTSGGYILSGIYVGLEVANCTLEVQKEKNVEMSI